MQVISATHSQREKRDRILTVALEAFFKSGFSAARMETIADLAGIAKGTLYLYFPSKEVLFKELVNSFALPNLEDIASIALNAPSIFDVLNQLAVHAPNMVRFSNMPKIMKVLISDSQNFPDILIDYRARILDRMLATLTSLLTDAMARCEIEQADPALLARLLVAPIAFSGIWEAIFGGVTDASVDLEGLFHLHAKLMIKALTPQPALVTSATSQATENLA